MSDGRIAVIGTGYVGLTSGTCLASLGHEVVCGDVDPEKVARMSRGEVPIFEEGLEELMRAGIAAGNLTFVHGAADAVHGAKYIFLCLPTPDGGDGRADLRIVHQVVAEISSLLDPGAILVTKSTVPVGTAKDIRTTLDRDDVFVVSNPEFLQEGTAVRNFMKPDRVVVGSDHRPAAEAVAALYEALDAPAVITSAESSELIKYASNAFLAMKLSFINSIAGLAEVVGADVTEIAGGMGFDDRIGNKFLKAGPGWGGSCFPKDTKALATIALDNGVSFPLLTATVQSNEEAQSRVADRIRAAAGGDLAGVPIGVWGLTFKAGTDDLRDSPALEVVLRLDTENAVITAYDPTVEKNLPAKNGYPDVTVAADVYEAARGAQVIVLLTEWSEFTAIDLAKVAEVAPRATIVDCRNILDPAAVAAAGLKFQQIGRPIS
ncbi:UDP-glucose/GDP-mannose dehydrogenase family protein [Nakamurella sp. A5-74]|uniref:UDP-glucose 6-dehydrogenase n=1 Tax=Nakamurella sp. A5-74 TaxID=3158264 RepID=A0AAU8DM72_9ACTN